MDKKTKKRLETLRAREQKLRQQLAGIRKQLDDPAEAEALQRQIAEVHAEIERLKEA